MSCTTTNKTDLFKQMCDNAIENLTQKEYLGLNHISVYRHRSRFETDRYQPWLSIDLTPKWSDKYGRNLSEEGKKELDEFMNELGEYKDESIISKDYFKESRWEKLFWSFTDRLIGVK